MMQGAKGNIVRVFPRRTSATPDDPLAFSGPPPKGGVGEVDEIHISVAFTYDMEKAERLAEQWSSTGLLVRLGGPAFNTPGGRICSRPLSEIWLCNHITGLPKPLLVLHGSSEGGRRPAGAAHHRRLECAGR